MLLNKVWWDTCKMISGLKAKPLDILENSFSYTEEQRSQRAGEQVLVYIHI
jgi:hypothetical protein